MNSHPFPEGQIPSIRRVMMPRDTNAGGTIFGGVILSEIDLAAAIEAHKHHPGPVVTVAMDKIDFKEPVNVGDLVSFYTFTEKVGRTSIQVKIDVWAQRRFGSDEHISVTVACATFVAVDENSKPTPVLRTCDGYDYGAE
ncbi:MAG: acyl-CoA thioesterase YciA [Planctomycetota bacterium]|jgi:acyl-CoA thioesterase YciA